MYNVTATELIIRTFLNIEQFIRLLVHNNNNSII